MWPMVAMMGVSAMSSIMQGNQAAANAEQANAQNADQFEKSMDYKMWSDKQNAQYLKEQGAYNAAALQANSANDWAMKAANLNTNWAGKQVDTAALYGAPGQKFSVAKPELPAMVNAPNYNDFVSGNETYTPGVSGNNKPIKSVRDRNSASLGDPQFSATNPLFVTPKSLQSVVDPLDPVATTRDPRKGFPNPFHASF